MRVLLISGEYPPMRGGVADYTAILANALTEAGCQVTVLTAIQAASCEDGRRATAASPAVTVHARLKSWNARNVWRDVVPFVEEQRPDVVHLQYQTGAFGMRIGVNLLPWLLRARAHRPRVLVTFHDLKEPYLLPKIGRARHLATVVLASGADAVVVTNDEDYLRMRSAAAPDQTRPVLGRRALAAIPIGSNIVRLPGDFVRNEWRGRIGAAAADIVVGFFGFLVPSKGLETLVAAFEQLLADCQPVRLAMIGASAGDTDVGGDSYAAEIRRRLAREGIRERITWTGFASEEAVSAYLRACDVVCLPYREGASLRHGTLAAAIVHGLPIVTTRSDARSSDSGLPCLSDSGNVLLVPPGDVGLLASALASLVSSSSLRERLKSGVADLAAQLDWQTIASRHVDLYRRLVAK